MCSENGPRDARPPSGAKTRSPRAPSPPQGARARSGVRRAQRSIAGAGIAVSGATATSTAPLHRSPSLGPTTRRRLERHRRVLGSVSARSSTAGWPPTADTGADAQATPALPTHARAATELGEERVEMRVASSARSLVPSAVIADSGADAPGLGCDCQRSTRPSSASTPRRTRWRSTRAARPGGAAAPLGCACGHGVDGPRRSRELGADRELRAAGHRAPWSPGASCALVSRWTRPATENGWSRACGAGPAGSRA